MQMRNKHIAYLIVIEPSLTKLKLRTFATIYHKQLTSQVENQAIQLSESRYSLLELVNRSAAKAVNFYITNAFSNMIGCVDRIDGYLISRDFELQNTLRTVTNNANSHLRAALATQQRRHIGTFHSDDILIVDGHNTVVWSHTDTLGRRTRYSIDDHNGIAHHIKLDADTAKFAILLLVDTIHLLGGNVR